MTFRSTFPSSASIITTSFHGYVSSPDSWRKQNPEKLSSPLQVNEKNPPRAKTEKSLRYQKRRDFIFYKPTSKNYNSTPHKSSQILL